MCITLFHCIMVRIMGYRLCQSRNWGQRCIFDCRISGFRHKEKGDMMYKVVVVEDEKVVRQGIILSTDWTLANCMVVGEADNGEEGLSVIEKCSPDIVITDICMPTMTGIEMVEKLSKKGDMPFVIFLTAYDDFSYAQQAVRLAVSDYILKPFKDGELENSILRLLEKNKQKEQENQKEDANLSLKKGDKSKYLAEALAYIDAHYMDADISVQKVADSLGISGGHLSHLFRKETNFTMMNYVVNCRMRAAKNLLKDYHYKIYEVAEQVGYRDITYFSANFKKHVGISPSEYQDRYRA